MTGINLRSERAQLIVWLLILGVSGLILVAGSAVPALQVFPDSWVLPIDSVFLAVIDWLAANFKWFFRGLSSVLSQPMTLVNSGLVALPWSVVFALFLAISWQGGGARLCALTATCLLYILIVGYWEEAMNTLSLVLVSIPLSVLLGFLLGVWASRRPMVDKVLEPLLDFMQTIPAFAYLIPILILFGFGPVVGLVASVIFAVPPMVRNTRLGLQLVDASLKEVGHMAGCTTRQRFFWVELPSAWPQILVGFNQTTMAALSMVIIAAIIGGFDDIGWEVLSRMRKAQIGQSALSGLVIVALAILLDRITAAFAAQKRDAGQHRKLSFTAFGIAFALCFIVPLLLAQVLPLLGQWPDGWEFYPAAQINEAVGNILIEHGQTLASIKNSVQFYVLLPLKLGLLKSVAPFTWGFSLTPGMITGYWVVVAALVLGLVLTRRWNLAITSLIVGTVLFFGVTGIPWLVAMMVLSYIAYLAGGLRVCLIVLGSLMFLALSGLWAPAMLSIYLCGAAVAICAIFGGLLGVWAARSQVASSVLRVINDTLQTMPQFVLLIPALMFFQVGEFAALLAIIAYAIVPMIRYTEQGLRQVPPTLIEAGHVCGCTTWQMFWLVKLPAAKEQILLGLNQTVLYGLSMLVIAAMVGTTGLGQQIFVALGKADAGLGLTAGLGMALIAISVDRVLKALAK